jgi:hypothetical protein
MLSQHPVDRTLLHPLPGTCRQQLTDGGITPRLRTVLVCSGYVSEENYAAPKLTACGSSRPQTTTSCGPRTVEPVFGQRKTCQNMTMMSRRGLTGCESEWLQVIRPGRPSLMGGRSRMIRRAVGTLRR